MARPRKLKVEKKLSGTYRDDRDPVPDSVSLPAVSMPRPPEEIAKRMGDEALKIWGTIEPVLSAAGIFNRANMFQLVRYCRLLASWNEMQDTIDKIVNRKEGINDWSTQRLKDYMRTAKQAHDQLQDIDRAFGIMPLFADQVSSRAVEEKDDLDKLYEM